MPGRRQNSAVCFACAHVNPAILPDSALAGAGRSDAHRAGGRDFRRLHRYGRAAHVSLNRPFPASRSQTAFVEIEPCQSPILMVENNRAMKAAHLHGPTHHLVPRHVRDASGGEAAEQRSLPFRRPPGSAAMLDVVDAHRLTKKFFPRAGVMSRVTEHRVNVHRILIKFGVPAKIEPVLPGHQREIAAGIRVQVCHLGRAYDAKFGFLASQSLHANAEQFEESAQRPLNHSSETATAYIEGGHAAHRSCNREGEGDERATGSKASDKRLELAPGAAQPFADTNSYRLSHRPWMYGISAVPTH